MKSLSLKGRFLFFKPPGLTTLIPPPTGSLQWLFGCVSHRFHWFVAAILSWELISHNIQLWEQILCLESWGVIHFPELKIHSLTGELLCYRLSCKSYPILNSMWFCKKQHLLFLAGRSVNAGRHCTKNVLDSPWHMEKERQKKLDLYFFLFRMFVKGVLLFFNMGRCDIQLACLCIETRTWLVGGLSSFHWGPTDLTQIARFCSKQVH